MEKRGNGKQWIHSPENLINGRVTYSVKFIGKAEVPEPRGMPMVKAALQKLSFSRQLKRSEGAKPPKVELRVGIHSVSISDIKTKETLHSIDLHRISFCAGDKEDKRLFAFIAKLDDNKHYCYGLDSLHQANDITLTIGQAFQLAYERFMKDNQPPSSSEKVTDMSKRLQELESENTELRSRIAELEAGQQLPQNGNRVSSTTPLTKDAFNMQPFVPACTVVRLPQPPSRKPVQPQGNLWSDDPFDAIQKSSRELLDMQNVFSRGLVMSEENVTLDSFDPLKH